MSMNTQGRQTTPDAIIAPEHKTISGNRGLAQVEKLIFEIGTPRRTGVDFPALKGVKSRLGGLERTEEIGLPGLSEPETMRHYVRLSQKNYAIDLGVYPLGSCTMKHNPRLNEKMARLPGFADVHPMQPRGTVQGALELMGELSDWICKLTGMPAVAMSPKAGAHGELCGMMAIRTALDAKNAAHKRRILVPESAHGTNPATAVQCGFTIDSIPATDDGRVDMDALKAKLGDDVAGIMLTNPNTCGLFERDIIEIADLIHGVGGYFYCDGANFNALVGRVRPGDLGIDAMHLNLHKTFSTPHGGGGPGSGPTVLSDALAPFAPVPYVEKFNDSWKLVENVKGSNSPGRTRGTSFGRTKGTSFGRTKGTSFGRTRGTSFGRMTAFHGQMGMFVRALSYMLSHGADGLKQATEDAVLNANYVQASLSEDMSPAFGGICMHEALFNDEFLKDTGVETLDFAKAMIDEGYHPMTMYFPLVVHGAMLIEPTESESKAELDRFIDVMKGLAKRAKAASNNKDGADFFKAAPIYAPMRRLDETQAARKPILRWREQWPA